MRRLFSGLRRSIWVLLLVASLAFNALLVVNEAVFAAVSGLVGAATGLVMPKARLSGEVASLSKDLDAQKRINRELRQEAAVKQAELVAERQAKRQIKTELVTSAAELAVERKAVRELRGTLAVESAKLAAETVVRKRAEGKVANLSAGISKVSAKVKTRMVTAAKRETASIAGKAIPGWGVGVIVAATALEINDLCQTVVDMKDMEALFAPQAQPLPEDFTICGVEPPSKSELMATVANSPHAAWEAARAVLPDLSEIDLSKVDLKAAGAEFWSDAVGFGSQVATGLGDAKTALDTELSQFQSWLYAD